MKFHCGWPTITKDEIEGRLWIHHTPPIYYLHKYPVKPELGYASGKWVVINRETDFSVTRFHRRRCDCVKEFMRKHRPKV